MTKKLLLEVVFNAFFSLGRLVVCSVELYEANVGTLFMQSTDTFALHTVNNWRDILNPSVMQPHDLKSEDFIFGAMALFQLTVIFENPLNLKLCFSFCVFVCADACVHV